MYKYNQRNNNFKKVTIFDLIIFLLFSISLTGTYASISVIKNEYDNLNGMLSYQLINRVDDCNIFINGFNERKKICQKEQ